MSEAPDFDGRVAFVLPYTKTGPDFIRAVADNLRTARRMNAEGRYGEAEFWLTEAEQALQRLAA